MKYRSKEQGSGSGFFILILIIAALYYFNTNPNAKEQLKGYFKEAESFFRGSISALTGDIQYGGFANEDSSSDEVSESVDLPVSLPGGISRIDSRPVRFFAPRTDTLTVHGIIANTNEERTSRGFGSLSGSTQLSASAQVKAQDILDRQYFEHTAPDGTELSDLVDNQNYEYVRIGENLALGTFKDDADVVTAWMNSPGHRANILEGKYTEIGIGIASGTYEGKQVVVAVQHFGTPKTVCPSIDSSLKARFESGQIELEAMANELETLSKVIEEGRAQGKSMNEEVATYNANADVYKLKVSEIDALRKIYNVQVEAFNTCIQ